MNLWTYYSKFFSAGMGLVITFVPTITGTEMVRLGGNSILSRRRKSWDVRKVGALEGKHIKGSRSGVITSLGMESGSHATS